MTLSIGDRVWWRDPDDDIGSGAYHIVGYDKENSEIVHLRNNDGDEAQAMSMELSDCIEDCPHCEAEGPQGFTQYVAFIDQCLCEGCCKDYLTERIDELISDFSVSAIADVLAHYVSGLVDNVHDSYKAGALDEELNGLTYESIVPVLEAPLEMAVAALSAVADGMEKAGY